jgi:ADP-heptose:LPS heptosyltransferase
MWLANEESVGGDIEVAKCRHRVISYLTGDGLDLGCGNQKIKADAIGIDFKKTPAVDLIIDLTANDPLRMFSDNYFDYIFSSHTLEDFTATEAVLDSWWKKIKPNGYLILYGPDPDFYPRIGTAGSNLKHKRDLYWWDVWKILKGFGNAKKISASRHNDSNEFSWLLVVQKKYGIIKKPFDIIRNAWRPFGSNGEGKVVFPRRKKAKKEALVIRYGAIGDAVWVTPLLRQLKKEGYRITYNCTTYSAQVLRNNPNIDDFFIQDREAIPNEDLGPYWKTVGKDFDRVINLSQSIERKLLVAEGTKEFKWSHKKRIKECDVNYQDATMAHAGYPELKGEKPELFFTEMEEALARHLRNAVIDKFWIMWPLSGSSFHKLYPWAPYVAGELDRNYDDIAIITVGDHLCKMIEWQMKNTINRAGDWTIRQSMIATKYCDLVIGPETGILNAASCYDTPKIVFLSHSSEENLTKYWRNVTPLYSKKCSCYPCHRLMYTFCCPRGEREKDSAKCQEMIEPQVVYDAIMKYYKPWKEAKEKKAEAKKKK